MEGAQMRKKWEVLKLYSVKNANYTFHYAMKET